MGRSRAVREARAGLFRSQLTLQLDDDGQLMIQAGPLFKRELRKVLREIEEDARDIVRRRHGRPDRDGTPRTGRLRRSIHAGQVRRITPTVLRGTVSAGSRLAPYARYVHEGSGPHPIRARRAKALRFWMPDTGGKAVEVIRQGPARGGTRALIRSVEIVGGGPGVGYRRSVMHPGYKGDKFLNNAAVGVVRRYGGTVRRRDGSVIPPS